MIPNDDLISRSSTIDALIKKGFYPAIVRRVLEEAPAVDTIEVVNCKDCKFHHWEQEPCHGKTVHFCDKLLYAEVTSDFYCAAGVRGKR